MLRLSLTAAGTAVGAGMLAMRQVEAAPAHPPSYAEATGGSAAPPSPPVTGSTINGYLRDFLTWETFKQAARDSVGPVVRPSDLANYGQSPAFARSVMAAVDTQALQNWFNMLNLPLRIETEANRIVPSVTRSVAREILPDEWYRFLERDREALAMLGRHRVALERELDSAAREYLRKLMSEDRYHILLTEYKASMMTRVDGAVVEARTEIKAAQVELEKRVASLESRLFFSNIGLFACMAYAGYAAGHAAGYF